MVANPPGEHARMLALESRMRKDGLFKAVRVVKALYPQELPNEWVVEAQQDYGAEPIRFRGAFHYEEWRMNQCPGLSK